MTFSANSRPAQSQGEQYIWWINWQLGQQLEHVLEHKREQLPEAVAVNLDMTLGRAGRGRLFGGHVLSWQPPAHIHAWFIKQGLSGIAVSAADLDVVRSLGGFITDLDLNVIAEGTY